MKLKLFAAAAALIGTAGAAAPVLAPPAPIAAEFQQYVSVSAGQIALTHVRVIDGTGAAPAEDQTILLDGAKIAAVQPASAPIPNANGIAIPVKPRYSIGGWMAM